MKMASLKHGLALACISCFVQPVPAQPRASQASSGTTFRFDVKGTRLAGYIVKRMFPGSPNYDSIKRGDEPQEHWVLRLVKPITVVADPADEYSQTERNVSEIQLVLDDKGYKKYRPFLGKRQLVTIK